MMSLYAFLTNIVNNIFVRDNGNLCLVVGHTILFLTVVCLSLVRETGGTLLLSGHHHGEELVHLSLLAASLLRRLARTLALTAALGSLSRAASLRASLTTRHLI